MRNRQVKIELQVILDGDNVIGCALYYVPTGVNLVAMCYIRQALLHGQFDFSNGIIIISCDENQFPFTGNSAHLQDLCELMKTGAANNFRQLYGHHNGREIMVIGRGKANEEKTLHKEDLNVRKLPALQQAQTRRERQRKREFKGSYFCSAGLR